MWRWTKPNDIKVVILDGDSLDDSLLNYPYNLEIQNVNICKVVRHSPTFINTDNFHEYFDIYSLINNIMHEYECNSYSIIAISSDTNFLKQMMQNHIGTILAGNVNDYSLRNVPDFNFNNHDRLIDILNQTYIGFGGEAIVSGYINERKSMLYSTTNVVLNNGETKKVKLYFGGRYYSKTHNYFNDDPLSVTLRSFKWNYQKAVDVYYDKAISRLNKNEHIDILTYIPLKPNEIIEGKFDRFKSLILEQSNNLGIELQSIIKCNSNFTQKGKDYNTRQENVNNAYELTEDVTDKNVVVLDDLYTSGATIKEIAKSLYNNGAKSVRAILLAVNQTIESTSSPYISLKCPICGDIMSLKLSTNGNLFFGCNSYMIHPNINSSINFNDGINQIKEINKLKLDIIDLEDVY